MPNRLARFTNKHFGLDAGPFVLLALSSLIALAVIAVVVWFGTRAVTEPPPLAYDATEYRAERSTLCPGDSLVYTPTLKVRSAGRIDIVRILWNRDVNQAGKLIDGTTAELDDNQKRATRALPFTAEGASFRNRAKIKIPANLAPGNYWLLTNTVGIGTDQSQYVVSFTVPEGCRS